MHSVLQAFTSDWLSRLSFENAYKVWDTGYYMRSLTGYQMLILELHDQGGFYELAQACNRHLAKQESSLDRPSDVLNSPLKN